MLDINAEYLRYAYSLSTHSIDSSNQNGAIIVAHDNNLIATGVNNFPIGIKVTPERSDQRPTKYRYFEHAERAAIYRAARMGQKVFGATMYAPWAACCDCARGIINSGITTLVVHQERMLMTPERWKPIVDEALSMLNEAGVHIHYHSGPIDGAPSILINGEVWNPMDAIVNVGQGNYYVEMGEER